MDITDISKVASRKRMNTDAEKLREKVSRETAKIIKLKVAQDTAYWDLKERLQQLTGAHERLQQNMLDVQMQHEAASARYQSELRLRPDTLNKLHGTRDICDVLEDYGERLRRSVARCRADRCALSAAYAQCGVRVRRLADDGARARRDAALQRHAAHLAAERQQAEAQRLRDALQQLGGARARCDELSAARRELAERLERATEHDERKEEAAAAMRAELSRLVREFEAQSADMQRTIIRQEKETQESAGAAAERVARLSRELSDAHCACAARDDALRRLQAERQEAANTIDHLRKEATTHVEELKKLETIINDKKKHEKDMEADISSLKQYLCKLEAEKLEVREQLDKAVQECSAKANTIDKLTRDTQELQRSLTELQAAFTSQREADAKKIEELTAADSAKQRELDANTGAIASLMAELKSEAEARARADSARDAAAERARLLDHAVQRLDAELAAHMAVLLDMRGEKERLQERIQGMQNTIDNIQKELTGRLLAPKGAADGGEPPELDAPLYNFLSDGSLDGDALDPREVGRRFAALRRQHAAQHDAQHTAQHTAQHAAQHAAQGSMSLSQIKDDMKIKTRTFFKNKRSDLKLRKFKQTDQ